MPDFSHERDLLKKGYRIIAGFDEAGRGSLAGPFSVGCVIYNSDFILNPPEIVFEIINDSKKLTAKKRNSALTYILNNTLFASAHLVPHKVVDNLNINGATKFSINMLVEKLPVKPDALIIDGNFKFDFGIPTFNIKNGDSQSLSIAAASIVAKVKRDEIMMRMDAIYPGYGFAQNMGYGTSSHRIAIQTNGPSPIHRLTYEPLKGMLASENSNK